jgi:hypothetical protein
MVAIPVCGYDTNIKYTKRIFGSRSLIIIWTKSALFHSVVFLSSQKLMWLSLISGKSRQHFVKRFIDRVPFNSAWSNLGHWFLGRRSKYGKRTGANWNWWAKFTLAFASSELKVKKIKTKDQIPMVSNVICLGIFHVQWFKVRRDCSLCWYWLNCWPSLICLTFFS